MRASCAAKKIPCDYITKMKYKKSASRKSKLRCWYYELLSSTYIKYRNNALISVFYWLFLYIYNILNELFQLLHSSGWIFHEILYFFQQKSCMHTKILKYWSKFVFVFMHPMKHNTFVMKISCNVFQRILKFLWRNLQYLADKD